MLKLGPWAMAAFAFAAAGASSFFAVRAYILDETPRQVMAQIEARLAQAGGGVNTCFHRRDPTPTIGRIQRPNPDILPTTMAYDVSENAVRLSGVTTSPTYWSLSIFQHNSDNIFVLNDRDLPSSRFDVVIVREGRVPVEAAGAIVINSPTDTGVVLVRRFLPDDQELDAIVANQDAMTCKTISYLPSA